MGIAAIVPKLFRTGVCRTTSRNAPSVSIMCDSNNETSETLCGTHLGSAGQEGPEKNAAAPPAPTSSLRSGEGLEAEAWEENTRAVRPLLESTAYASSSAPANAPEAPWSVQAALLGVPSTTKVNSKPLVSDLPPARFACCE